MEHQVSVKALGCLVGCLHLIAFSSLLLQVPLLFGGNGLQPVAAYLQEAAQQVLRPGASYAGHAWAMLVSNPSLLWFHTLLGLSAETMFHTLCAAGIAAALATACGMAHSLLVGALWALYLSVVGVGQAFLPVPGDTVLLELTFACIWLSINVSPSKKQQQHGEQLEQQQDQPPAGVQAASRQPALFLLRWLLFKLLLLSSSIKASVACSAVSGLADCYRVMVSHGQPHTLTWLAQALPSPLAAAAAALTLLELPAAFLVLCPSPRVQQPTAAVLLVVQLVRAVLGSAVLFNLAAAVLCLALMDDSMVVPHLQRVQQALTAKQAAAAGAAGSACGSAELFAYKSGGHKRTMSNDSLASLLSEPDLQQLPAGFNQQRFNFLTSRTSQASAAVIAVVAGAMFSYSSSTGLVLRPSAQQLTAVLHVLVPAAAAIWLGVLLLAAVRSCKEAFASAAAATAAAAASQAKAGPTAASAARAKPSANGLTSPELLSPTMSPMFGTVHKASVSAGIAQPPAGPDTPLAAAEDPEDSDTAKPAGVRRRGTAKAAAPSGTPRKGGRGKAAAAAATSGEDSDATASVGGAAEAATAAKGKRGPAARGKKAAAAAAPAAADAAAAEVAEPEAAAQTPAAPTPAPAATPATTLAPIRTPATATPAAAHAAAAPAASGSIGLVGWLAPQLRVVWAVLTAAAVLAVFFAGLPAVLAPAGYTQTTLRCVPGLLSSYRVSRNFGITSSGTSSTLAWQHTAAAGQQLPGSHLMFELSTSADGAAWQPVRFRQGLGSAGLGADWGWGDVLGALRGPYEPRLQGRLAAAGSGSLVDNMWLVNLADKLLEGSAELAPFLQQPLQPHNWVKIDLVRYSPSSLPGSAAQQQQQAINGAGVAGGSWRVQHVAEVLPGMPRGDADLKETLAEMGWATDPAAQSAVGAFPASLASAPVLVVGFLLALVVARHCFLPGGLVCSVSG